jgi:cytochrome c6
MLMVKKLSVWFGTFVALMACTLPVFAQTGDADNGKKLFSAKCATCHAQDGSGNTSVGKSLKAADLRSPDVQKKSDADFYTQVEKGKGKMPPFGAALNKTQINDVVAYLRELGKLSGKK